MPCRLPADCLNEIFENLEDDKTTLHSCLLVNRLWCEVSVRILWRDIWDYKYTAIRSQFDALISCLPNESKELLRKNEMFANLKPQQLLFNYASFCKVLSIDKVCQIICDVITDNTAIFSLDSKDSSYL